MTLKKIIREKNKIIEKYSIEAPFLSSCKIPEGYKDITDAISSKLKDYCVFDKTDKKLRSTRNIIGGPIPNSIWNGIIETTDGRNIDLEIVQSYEQPYAHLSRVNVEMKYADKVSEEDLNIIRKAFTNSGLERID